LISAKKWKGKKDVEQMKREEFFYDLIIEIINTKFHNTVDSLFSHPHFSHNSQFSPIFAHYQLDGYY